jgi:hypothetical protein
VEDLTETVVESIAVKPASGSQFGGGLDDAGDDHGDDEIALAAGNWIEDGIQMQVAQAAEHGGDMAVRQGTGDVEGLWQRGRGDSQRAGQCQAEGVNLLRGEMSDVGNGASFDFTVEAIGFAEEDGGRGVAVGHGGDVHAYIILSNKHICKTQSTFYMPTIITANLPNAIKIKRLPRLAVRTSD